MKVIFVVGLLWLNMTTWAQKSITINDVDAIQRELKATFNAIKIEDGIELLLSRSEYPSLAISASAETDAGKIKTEIVDEVLHIYFDGDAVKGSNSQKRRLKAYVSFVGLNKLDISGGASVKFPVSVSVSSLEVKITSGGKLSGLLEANELVMEQTSGAVVQLSGKVNQLTVSVTSGASFDGYEMLAQKGNAKATSGGNIKINIENELNAKAITGGAILYKGNPSVKEVNVNTGGRVKKSS